MDKNKIYRIVVMSVVNLLMIMAINYIIENASVLMNGGDFAGITANWMNKIISLNYLGLWLAISVGFAFLRNRE